MSIEVESMVMGDAYSLISLHSGAIEADIMGKEVCQVQKVYFIGEIHAK